MCGGGGGGGEKTGIIRISKRSSRSGTAKLSLYLKLNILHFDLTP